MNDTTVASPAPPWIFDDPGMVRAVTWYEANRHREDLPMLLRVMELELAARKTVPPTKTETVPPRPAAIDDILSLAEAAAMIGLSADWLQRQHSRLPEGVAIQRAKRCAVCFRRIALLKWLNGGRILAPATPKERK